MRPERLIYVVVGSRRPGSCRDCGRPIEWVVSSAGKNLPLNPHPLVLRAHENAGGVKFEVVSSNNLHFVTCQRKRERPKRPRAFGGRARP